MKANVKIQTVEERVEELETEQEILLSLPKRMSMSNIIHNVTAPSPLYMVGNPNDDDWQN